MAAAPSEYFVDWCDSKTVTRREPKIPDPLGILAVCQCIEIFLYTLPCGSPASSGQIEY